MPYILGIDQSTSGTKALLFDGAGELAGRVDRSHRQMISPEGWVSHDPEEIYENVLWCVEQLLAQSGAATGEIAGIGISNQRETALVWERNTGRPLCNAVVWQCSRGEGICGRLESSGEMIRRRTGLPLSPYFSAAKIAWILENHPDLPPEQLCAGTVDSWLVYRLTGGKVFRTDYSNASRTQLFHIEGLEWDREVCGLFGIAPGMLAEVTDSDGDYGETDCNGLLQKPVPIRGVLGDSHGALFAQGCLDRGMAKATYGTGSSVMLNTGASPVFSDSGLVTSLAWRMDGRACYVLEGNINYTGAVIKWLVEDLGLLPSSKEAGAVARQADPNDETYLVPAFSGLGAPYWNSAAKAMLCGMGRGTGRAEIVKAAEESIGYQIADIVRMMDRDTGELLTELRTDGGPTRDDYLMQFQSDILGIPVRVSRTEELSGMGAAYMAGLRLGVYKKELLQKRARTDYRPAIGPELRRERYRGWQAAVKRTTVTTE